MEPIVKLRVYVLGHNDMPLTPSVDVIDPSAIQAVQGLLEAEQAKPRVTHAHTGVVRAVVRTGIATLVRTLRLKPTTITDDGKLVQG